MKKLPKSLALLAAITLGTSAVDAQLLLTFDEFGNSNYQPGQLLPDPTGGYTNGPVLVFNLPFLGVQGDVLMHEGSFSNAFLDVIRFTGQGQLIFYSDNTDGIDAPADTLAPPNPLFPNQVHILEVGPEGNNGAFYTPTPGQPGFDPSLFQYHFISDVPEPGALTLLLAGTGLLHGVRRKRQKLAS